MNDIVEGVVDVNDGLDIGQVPAEVYLEKKVT